MTSASTTTPRRAVWLVARREIIMRVRTKGFVIGTAAIIVVLAGYLLLQNTLFGGAERSTVGLSGQATAVAEPLKQAAQQLGHEVETRDVPSQQLGRQQVADGELDALVSGAPAALKVLADDDLDADLRNSLNGLAQQQVLAAKLAEAEVEDPAGVLNQVNATEVQVSYLNPPEPDRGQRLVMGLVLAFLLYMSVATYGMQVATGVVEEKSSRIVEILLATLRPWQLLLGKVLGLGVVGLIQLTVIGVVGLAVASATGALTISGVAAGALGWGIGWYLLGYFLYATLFAAAASLVSRQEETQQVTAPMLMILVIGFVAGLNMLVQDSAGAGATVLSLIPLLSPIMMPGRIAMGTAPVWQIGLALVLTVATIVLVTWLAGRIYRNAVLHTGSRVKLRDALR
ncbi:MAG: ABC transporter permease subunit [Pseudonocardiaceae bacterium]|nr:ABC transporter permease subunit [Pseudonocardiaceae bacterium]